MNPVRQWLLPLSWLYGAGTAVRNFCYDTGLFRVHRVPVCVICAGNITAGGTGKTPLAEHLLQYLLDQGHRPALLSRGYGRRTRGYLRVSPQGEASEFGDEPLQIARRLRNVPVFVCEDRVEGALRLLKECSASVIVLDDGFQHRRLHRDLDIVVMDASRLPAQDALLPAGRLREPRRALKRAHFAVVSKLPDHARPSEYPSGMPGSQTAWARLVPEALVPFGNEPTVAGPEMKHISFFAFAGIGNTDAFFRTVAGYTGSPPAQTLSFPDHHPFSQQDLQKILDIFARMQSISPGRQQPVAITTEKDFCRMTEAQKDFLTRSMPVYYLRARWNWAEGGERLHHLIQTTISSYDR